MPETTWKLQPNRTIQLRACDDRGAAAALHSATENGFTVSGIFRDLADVCVLELWNADNFYEHPRLKYLPDVDFTGIVLSFHVEYTGLQPLDSPWYPYAAWPFLSVLYDDGTVEQVKLIDHMSGGVVRIGFSALAQPASVRQMWLTFVPEIVPDGPQPNIEWSAVFSDWQVTGDRCALKVAGPGSVRIEESDAWCSYSGASWTLETGFYSKGFARRVSAIGDSVRVRYFCQYEHDLYLGTVLGGDLGEFGVSFDGDTERLPVRRIVDASTVITRQRLRATVAAGEHTAVLTLRSGVAYFDFLEAAVLSDLPDPLPALDNISPALDYDTDHSYKLPPARIMWALDQLGYAGPMNLYSGVFFWNQRKRVGGDVQQSTVTFSGSPGPAAAVTLIFGDPADPAAMRLASTTVESPEAIAAAYTELLNSTSTVFWAEADRNVLKLHGRSTGRIWRTPVSCETKDGITAVCFNENLWFTTGQWQVDPDQEPVLTRAARDWHADLFRECAVREREIVASLSMELFNTPDVPGNVWAARFPSGKKVLTATGFGTESPCAVKSVAYGAPVVVEVPKHDYDTGDLVNVLDVPGIDPATKWEVAKVDADHFGLGGSSASGTYSGGGTAYRNLRTTHCSFVSAMREYQTRAFVALADLMAAAGLKPRLQFGEFCWWYFADGGMAYYDAETAAAAQARFGRALWRFSAPNDDPAQHQADADFLRSRLVAHMATIRQAVKAAHPDAEIELLLPLDVNYPEVYGVYKLGGRLNHYVNIPAEFRDPKTAPFDRIKMEGLDFGSGSRDLDKARRAASFPTTEMSWPIERCRYLMPVFNGGCPWEREVAAADRVPVVLWAFDHVCLLGWNPARGPTEVDVRLH